MFLGQYQHSVDEKGRVVMPAKYRDRLVNGVVVTKGQEKCLYVFPADRWTVEAEKIKRLSRNDPRVRMFSRAFFSAASDQQSDKQGRLMIPPPLRAYAGLEKDVMVVGNGEHLEIWDLAAWEHTSAEADELYAGIDAPLPEEGF